MMSISVVTIVFVLFVSIGSVFFADGSGFVDEYGVRTYYAVSKPFPFIDSMSRFVARERENRYTETKGRQKGRKRGSGLILGIGHDLEQLERVRGIITGKTGGRFIERVLTPAEREHAVSSFGPGVSDRWIEFTAGRFAAKEAVAKALGCGIGGVLGFQDIEILPEPGGRPVCRLSCSAFERLRLDPDRCVVHVTISHTRTMVSAVAIAEARDRSSV